MPRTTGNYRNSTVAGETVRAFVPATLPPDGPPLRVEGPIDAACARAMAAVGAWRSPRASCQAPSGSSTASSGRRRC